MIYDQECAAEKRRKRSRGKYAEPAMRLMIHEEVCEGCGDCVKQSNCMSLQSGGDAIWARRCAFINRRAIRIIRARWAIVLRSSP